MWSTNRANFFSLTRGAEGLPLVSSLRKAKKKLLEMQQREERDSPRLRGEVAVAFNGKCVLLGDM